ncbi:UDP-2,4-diacetamido-2,4,6-trideoxy-beta-L-altropyranose hydrolase [Candidatus Pelagibacter communis]|uniref:UDP-2,4-diacetamido-2,4, 6-trideoxy-beta-L-altropyranose hydrolase n=1 Tax=Pelagibacter ubique TaxID=198252 RepID=UPI00094DD4C4|nr:UDP-2,4-diacetamido-2,4,6-trideoxy-beta-L-altropyranose hydrolase [Candidatus Pelagibacter ubique]
MNRNIGIIVNESSDIGSGHAQRCINLASQLSKTSRKFYFFSNKKILKKNTYSKINIIIKEQNFIKYKKIKYLSKIKKIIRQKKISILIIDLYDIKYDLEKKLCDVVNKLIVFDDYCHNRHNCDILINNNFLNSFQKKKIKNNNPKTKKFFLGEKYFLINKRLIKNKNKSKNKNKTIFIFFGNAEQNSETLKVIKTLSVLDSIFINCVIGKYSKDKKKIFNYCKKFKFIKLFYNVTNNQMFKIMKKSDVSIGSGGVNLLERLSLGMPSIVYLTAKNQLSNVTNLSNKKNVIYVGKSHDKNLKKIKNIFLKYGNKESLFQRIFEKSKKISFVKNNQLLSKELIKILNQ